MPRPGPAPWNMGQFLTNFGNLFDQRWRESGNALPAWLGESGSLGDLLLNQYLSPETARHSQVAPMFDRMFAAYQADPTAMWDQVQQMAANKGAFADPWGWLDEFGAQFQDSPADPPADPPPQDPPQDPSMRPAPGDWREQQLLQHYRQMLARDPNANVPDWARPATPQRPVHPSMQNLPAGVTPPPGAEAYRLGPNGEHMFRVRGQGGANWITQPAASVPAPGAGTPPAETPPAAPTPGPVWVKPGDQDQAPSGPGARPQTAPAPTGPGPRPQGPKQEVANTPPIIPQTPARMSGTPPISAPTFSNAAGVSPPQTTTPMPPMPQMPQMPQKPPQNFALNL